MPVYDRRYRGWDGPRRLGRARFWILARHGLSQVFASRFATLLFGLAAIVPLGWGLFVYSIHNVDLLLSLGVAPVDLPDLNLIGPDFFILFLLCQTGLSFLLTAFVGPTLVAPDLTHNALPLYLSRPFSRAEYLLGKFAVLAVLLSLVTWVPGVLLILLQGSLAGGDWLAANTRLFAAIIAAAGIWVVAISLVALAISAWFRWRPVATAMFFGILMVAKGFGLAIVETLDTRWGKLIVFDDVVRTIWMDLFGIERLFAQQMPDPTHQLPVAGAWIALAAVCGFSLLALRRKVQACEVSR
jgi:ABC-2 type transport system permease protein